MTKQEKAILVAVDISDSAGWHIEDAMQELRELARSSGAEVIDEIICKRDKLTPAHFIGKGKAQEIGLKCGALGPDVVIFNDDLSFVQHRNLEAILNTKVIDRTQLILDIFALRAKSLEGKVQVELAQLSYLLPRLMGKGVMLSRLGGGIGTRGPGEQKLEMDRRRIRKRIAKLKRDLESMTRHRQTARKTREAHDITSVAFIGYTNAGKSTLLNTLTNAHAYVKDQLFSTLDPLSKKFVMPNNQKVVFVDTVGFLHKLPHHLIEAFKATLEEVVQSDILIHVLDVSHPRAKEHINDVYEVLRELGATDKPVITAFNKVDLVENDFLIGRYRHYAENGVAISALKGQGLEDLIKKLHNELASLFTRISMLIPSNKMGIVSKIYEEGKVYKADYNSDGVYIEADVPVRLKKKIEKEI